MDPFTLALATFGVQKLRGKSTRTAFKDAALIGGGAYAVGALAPQSAMGSMFANKPAFSSLGFGGGSAASAEKGNMFSKILGNKAVAPKGVIKDSAGNVIQEAAAGKEGAGFLGMGAGGKLALAAGVLPLLEGEGEAVKPNFTEEDYKKAYKEQSAKLEGGFEPGSSERPDDVEGDVFYANEGGLATALPHYNEGGINYLPSKMERDEKDYSNYIRAQGYVEDGTGAGDKDTDTMLAQLADGEFVSRADAVLGAGIMSGANPKDFEGMRKAGASFFYNQQKNLKRVYDITDGSNKEKN